MVWYGSKSGVSWALVGLLATAGMVPGLAEPVRVAQAPASSAAQGLIDEGMALLNQGSQESLEQALVKFAEAVQLAEVANDHLRMAWALTANGRISADLGNQQQALMFYEKSLELWHLLKDRDWESTTLNNIGLVYNTLGKRQKALEFLNRSLLIFQAVSDRNGEAVTLNNIGGVYVSLGERQKALMFFDQSLPIFQALGNQAMEATTLNNIGSTYDALGEKQKALGFFNQALLVFQTLGNLAMEATILNNIALAYDALGDKQKAIELYQQALPISRMAGHRSGEGSTLNNLGKTYSSLGEQQIALDFLNQALLVLQTVENQPVIATVFNNMGLAHNALDEKQRALDFYNQALIIVRAVGDRSGEATTLNNIGSVYNALGEKQQALDFYNQSLPLSQAVGDRSGEATTLNNIGLVYSDLGEQQKALDFYTQALPLSRAVGDRSLEAVTLHNIAWVYRTQNRLAEALTQINTAITLIEQLRSAIQDPNLKTSYFATVQDYYQFKIDLLMQLHQQDPSKRYDRQAFETNDQQRARTLRDLLTEANANLSKNISPELKAKENDLQSKLIAREKQLIEVSGKVDSETVIQQLKTDIADLLRQQQDLAQQIRRTSPEYAKLQYPTPITLTKIQQQLDDKTLLLQYSLGEKASYLWVVSNTSLTTYKLPKRTDLEPTIQAFRSALLDSTSFSRPEVPASPTGRVFPNLHQAANNLSQQILPPAATQLSQKKRLLIVADGALHKIPFAALAQPTPVGTNRRSSEPQADYHPLLETHTISYLPAASLIFPQYPNRPAAPKTIAILADPVFSPTDDRLKTTSSALPPPSSALPANAITFIEPILKERAARNLSFDRLPGTITEANDILKLIANPNEKTAVFSFDSNYNWATNPSLNQYRYLHLATHGLFDQERPELSSLILSLYTAKGEPQKAFLRLPELFNLDFAAEMVTLSACQTGLGDAVPGEGLVGMTRGLMYAGAKRVTLSLWNVADTETAELMAQFYRHLWSNQTTKLSHTEALRSAQLQMWKEGKHPYYWSAFILQGEWRN